MNGVDIIVVIIVVLLVLAVVGVRFILPKVMRRLKEERKRRKLWLF